MTDHILDNPIWYMLCHELVDYTTGTVLAKRCDPALIPTAALADHSEAAFGDFAALFQPGESITLINVNPPQQIPGFETGDEFSVNQLVADQRLPIPEHDVDILALTAADVPDIVQLIELTQPGPFFPGMFPKWRFVGIRQDGQLVALAGERMRVPGYSEITAVCTHPDWRGRGYAGLLTLVIAEGIWSRGETPFLHVLAHNDAAYRVYDRLHFVERTALKGITLTRV